MNGTLIFCDGMAEKNDHTRFSIALCKLARREAIQKRRVQAQSMPIMEVRSAKEATRLAEARKVVKSSKKSRKSSSSALEENAEEERPGEKKGMGKENKSQYGEIQGDGSTKAGCPESDAPMRFAK